MVYFRRALALTFTVLETSQGQERRPEVRSQPSGVPPFLLRRGPSPPLDLYLSASQASEFMLLKPRYVCQTFCLSGRDFL